MKDKIPKKYCYKSLITYNNLLISFNYKFMQIMQSAIMPANVKIGRFSMFANETSLQNRPKDTDINNYDQCDLKQ